MTTATRLDRLSRKLEQYSGQALSVSELTKIGKLCNTNYSMTKLQARKYGITVKTWRTTTA